MLRKLKSKLLTKLFTEWVKDEWDTELLGLTKSMIHNREQELNWMLHFASRVEVKGFRQHDEQ
jgi:hypothetical protein